MTAKTKTAADHLIAALMEFEKVATDRADKSAKQIAGMIESGRDGIGDAIMCSSRAIRDEAARRLWWDAIENIKRAVAKHPEIYDADHARCVVSIAAKEWVGDLYRRALSDSITLSCASPLTRAVKQAEAEGLRDFIHTFSLAVDEVTG
jgi:hypothetical protein